MIILSTVGDDDDSCNCNRGDDDDDDKDWMAWPVSSVSLPLASPCKEEVSSPPTNCCRCKMMNVMMKIYIYYDAMFVCHKKSSLPI